MPSLLCEVKGGGGRHINNGVSYALVLTVRSPGKTFNLMSRTKQLETHVGYVISRPTLHLSANGVSAPLVAWVYVGNFIHIGVKFGVARFDISGQIPGRLEQ